MPEIIVKINDRIVMHGDDDYELVNLVSNIRDYLRKTGVLVYL